MSKTLALIPTGSFVALAIAIISECGILIVAQAVEKPEGFWAIAQSVPALAVLVALMVAWLKHSDKRDDRHEQRVKEIVDSHRHDMTDLTAQTARSAERCAAALEKNSEMCVRVMTALDNRERGGH